MTNYKDWIKDLGLLPHPEGGYYKETYLHPETLFTQKGERSLSSSCLFLLTEENPSHLHRLSADETWFYHSGNALTVHCIFPDGNYEEVKIGPDVKKGQLLSWTVPAGTIFGSTVKSGYALVSCVVTPAFTFEDFELFTQEQLITHYPHLEKIIKQLAYE